VQSAQCFDITIVQVAYIIIFFMEESMTRWYGL